MAALASSAWEGSALMVALAAGTGFALWHGLWTDPGSLR